MKVAIVHSWLFDMRGGESLLEALCELYPEADIFTHVYQPIDVSETIRSHRVRTTFIQKMPFARKMYRQYLPLMPMALEMLDLTQYNLVISCESGPTKGVIVNPDALHLCYCHTPMRYLWDQYHDYYRAAGSLARLGMPYLFHRLRRWDVTSAARVDHFLASSTSVATRINKYWRRDADVIAPPVDTEKFEVSVGHDNYYLCVGELAPPKRIDLAIEACNALSRRLLIVGDGSELKALKKIAGPTIEFVGRASQAALRQYLTRCRGLLFPTQADFGMVAVEAMASGRPVIAYGRGGAQDTVVEGVTGILFQEQSSPALIEAIVRFELSEHVFDPGKIAAQALRFNRSLFKERFSSVVNTLLSPVEHPQLGRPARAALQAM